MNEPVGIVVVSHSPLVARGTFDMIREMVGPEVPCAFAGGNPAGGLGTDPTAIRDAIRTAWSPSGVLVMVDLGGAEMNAEMAVEMLEEAERPLVSVCDAPLVEGSVMAATEAAAGSDLEQVRSTALELRP